jgi:hypothetical protein
MKKWLPALLLLACFLVSASWPASAQDASFSMHPLRDAGVKSWPIVQKLPGAITSNPNAFLWILRGTGQSVGSYLLQAEPSGLMLNGQTQTLPPPLKALALMIDNSISMRPEWTQALNVIMAITQNMNRPHDTIKGVYSFSEEVNPVTSLQENNTQGLEGKLESLTPSGRNTMLYSGLRTVIDELSALPVLQREIVLLSDGGSEDRALRAADITRLARERGVIIHTVGFSGAPRRNAEARRDPRDMDVMRYLAEETGGRFAAFTDVQPLVEPFQNAKPITATVLIIDDINKLPYGDSKVAFTLLTKINGRDVKFQENLTVTGTQTLDNALVSVFAAASAAIGGRDPKLFLALCGAALLLVVLTVIVVSRRRAAQNERRKAEELAKQQEAERLKKEEQDRKLADIKGLVKDIVEKEEPAPEQLYGWLVDEDGPSYELRGLTSTIGRGPENDVVLPDQFISGKHAIIDFKNGQFHWSDRSPTNPTKINGELVKGSSSIAPGDVIECGKTRLIFKKNTQI